MDAFEQSFELRNVSLRDLWGIFVRRFIVMLLAAVVVVGGAFAYSQVMFVPRYDSTATLYLINRGVEEEPGMTTYNSFSLSLKLVNDCGHLLKSHAVLDQVISSLHLDMDYDDLYEAVTVVNPEETRILEVTVIADSPKQAKQIVDEICEVGVGKIEEAMGFEQAKLYEYGVLNEEPCNAMGLVTYAILAFAAAMAAYLFFLVRFLLDDRIRTDEDIERVLGLSILGDIPNADNPKKGRGYGKYGKYYGKKGYGDTPYGQAPAPTARPQGSLPGAKPAAHGKSVIGASGDQSQQAASRVAMRGAGQVNPAGRVASQSAPRKGLRADSKKGESRVSGAFSPSKPGRKDR